MSARHPCKQGILQLTLDRREFLRLSTILAGGALSTSCTRALRLWQPGGTREPSVRVLDADRRARLDSAVDLILPSTDSPGALEAGVPDFVEMMIVDYYYADERAMFIEGLDDLDVRSIASVGTGFVDAPESARTLILAQLEEEGLAQMQVEAEGLSSILGFGVVPGMAPSPTFFQALRELVAIGYCTSSLAADHHFQFAPIHAEFEGCVPVERAGRIHLM